MLAHISEDQLREQTVAEHTQGVYELCEIGRAHV